MPVNYLPANKYPRFADLEVGDFFRLNFKDKNAEVYEFLGNENGEEFTSREISTGEMCENHHPDKTVEIVKFEDGNVVPQFHVKLSSLRTGRFFLFHNSLFMFIEKFSDTEIKCMRIGGMCSVTIFSSNYVMPYFGSVSFSTNYKGEVIN